MTVRRGLADERWFQCPYCGISSIYADDLDRVMHADGSSNRECWGRQLRSEAHKYPLPRWLNPYAEYVPFQHARLTKKQGRAAGYTEEEMWWW